MKAVSVFMALIMSASSVFAAPQTTRAENFVNGISHQLEESYKVGFGRDQIFESVKEKVGQLSPAERNQVIDVLLKNNESIKKDILEKRFTLQTTIFVMSLVTVLVAFNGRFSTNQDLLDYDYGYDYTISLLTTGAAIIAVNAASMHMIEWVKKNGTRWENALNNMKEANNDAIKSNDLMNSK
jgi:hypothetical protein